eukprot:gb/GFBE01023242.1/.p1 GENE.gb/GFBE01023242.1/~~gb/GFBE01023242.1/.p1  ORF type:complete len:183 (+),score=33.80 gb/GFBE01023242.1/:1-549(+)
MVDAKTLMDLMATVDGESAVHMILEVLRARPTLSPAIIGYACPALTYAPARGMMERRCRGVIKQFDKLQGYGLISSPEIEATFGMDCIVKEQQVGAFQPGEEVSFTCVLAEDNRPQAYELLTPAGLPHPGGAVSIASAAAGALAGGSGGSEWADWNSWGSTGDVAANGSDPKRRRLDGAPMY